MYCRAEKKANSTPDIFSPKCMECALGGAWRVTRGRVLQPLSWPFPIPNARTRGAKMGGGAPGCILCKTHSGDMLVTPQVYTKIEGWCTCEVQKSKEPYTKGYSLNVTSSNSKVVHHVLPRRFIFRQSFGHSHGSTVGPFFIVVTPYSSGSAPAFLPFNVTFQH